MKQEWRLALMMLWYLLVILHSGPPHYTAARNTHLSRPTGLFFRTIYVSVEIRKYGTDSHFIYLRLT